MKTLLSYVLHRLHSLEAPIIRHRDVEGFRSGELTALRRCGILAAAPELDEIPHPDRPSSGQVAVVRKTTRGRFAVAPDEEDYFDPIPLSEEDVRAYSISVPNIVRLIRQDNDLTGDWEPNEQGIIPIGQKHLDQRGGVAVFLSVANHSPSEFSTRCLALRKPGGVKRMVVLLPLPIALTPQEHELLDARGITLVALAPLADEGNLTIDWEPLISSTSEERTADGGARKKRGLPRRSWTQSDLDGAIQEYKAKRASTYTDLVDGVRRGRAGAKKSAQKLFGRNAIVRALGVKSAAMVSNSPVWRAIAEELGLRGRPRKTCHGAKQRIGIEIALEERAMTASRSVIDEVIRRETITLVERSMPAREAKATVEKLERGEMTDDDARDLVKVFADQKQDERTRRIRQNL